MLVFVFGFFCLPVLANDGKVPPPERKVIAVAMSVSSTMEGSGRWRTWQNNKHNPEKRTSDGRRDIASVFYPSIGLYDVSDPDYIDCACQLMHLAGIDAITFFTPNTADGWRMNALKRWGDVMKKYNLTGMPRPQPKSRVEDLDQLMAVFKPVAFTYHGRPLLPFFNIDPSTLPALSHWKESFAPASKPILVKWLQQTCSPPFDGGFDWVGDATHPDRSISQKGDWKRYFDARLAREGYDSDVRRARQLLEKGAMSVYIDGVNPGFDDSAVNGWGRGSHYIERANGETYRYRWKRAVENGFDLACIPTWDDWGEGSMIEPTVEFGNLYLEITREYTAKFKGIAPRSGNFDLPQWIYLIRKNPKAEAARPLLTKACELLEKDEWENAEKLVRPLAVQYAITNRMYR